MSGTIIHEVETGDMRGWRVVENSQPHSGELYWSTGVINGGCLEYIGDSITVTELLNGETRYTQKELEYMRRMAIYESRDRVLDAGYPIEPVNSEVSEPAKHKCRMCGMSKPDDKHLHDWGVCSECNDALEPPKSSSSDR